MLVLIAIVYIIQSQSSENTAIFVDTIKFAPKELVTGMGYSSFFISKVRLNSRPRTHVFRATDSKQADIGGPIGGVSRLFGASTFDLLWSVAS